MTEAKKRHEGIRKGIEDRKTKTEVMTMTDREDDNVTDRRHGYGPRPDPPLGPMPNPPPDPDPSQTAPVYPDLRQLAQIGPTATPTVTQLKMQRIY